MAGVASNSNRSTVTLSLRQRTLTGAATNDVEMLLDRWTTLKEMRSRGSQTIDNVSSKGSKLGQNPLHSTSPPSEGSDPQSSSSGSEGTSTTDGASTIQDDGIPPYSAKLEGASTSSLPSAKPAEQALILSPGNTDESNQAAADHPQGDHPELTQTLAADKCIGNGQALHRPSTGDQTRRRCWSQSIPNASRCTGSPAICAWIVHTSWH